MLKRFPLLMFLPFLPLLTSAECPSAEKVNEILKYNGIKDVKVKEVHDYSEYQLCGLDLVTNEGRVVKNALFITPDAKFLIPKVGRIIKIESPLRGYYAVYVKSIDGRKQFLGYINEDGIFIPDIILLKQPTNNNDNSTKETNEAPTKIKDEKSY